MLNSLKDIFLDYFTMERKDSLEYKKPRVFSVEKNTTSIIPQHWVKELSILENEGGIKVAFSKKGKAITVYFPKDLKLKKEVFDKGGKKISKKDYLVFRLYFHILKHRLHSERAFKYDKAKDTFLPVTFKLNLLKGMEKKIGTEIGEWKNMEKVRK